MSPGRRLGRLCLISVRSSDLSAWRLSVQRRPYPADHRRGCQPIARLDASLVCLPCVVDFAGPIRHFTYGSRPKALIDRLSATVDRQPPACKPSRIYTGTYLTRPVRAQKRAGSRNHTDRCGVVSYRACARQPYHNIDMDQAKH